MSTHIAAEEKELERERPCSAEPLHNLWRKPFRVILAGTQDPSELKAKREGLLKQDLRVDASAKASVPAN
jgi:hypothetical protein